MQTSSIQKTKNFRNSDPSVYSTRKYLYTDLLVYREETTSGLTKVAVDLVATNNARTVPGGYLLITFAVVYNFRTLADLKPLDYSGMWNAGKITLNIKCTGSDQIHFGIRYHLWNKILFRKNYVCFNFI